jgi:chemotaxis family two-component system response regulator PixG
MNNTEVVIARSGTLEQVTPLNLLAQLSKTKANGCLTVSSGMASWSIFVEKGKLIYASLSIAPFERLERHLRRSGHQASAPVSAARQKVQQMFGKALNQTTDEDPDYQAICWLLDQQYIQPEESSALIEEFLQVAEPSIKSPDYQAICWLFSQKYLEPAQTASLIEELAKEVLESFLLLEAGTYEFLEQETLEELPKFCYLELRSLVEYCQKRLRYWQSLGPHIWSPYQRPYFFSQAGTQQQLSTEIQQKLAAVLKGYSFRHLAVLMNQDELKLVKSLRPYIESGAIFLREPQPPFSELPRISTATVNAANPADSSVAAVPAEPASGAPEAPQAATSQATYTIACVDDSPAMLNEISRFLNDENCTVITISDPVKALMQIVRAKPDLILLDVGMPTIDGYELCRLLRNHSLFKATPIVMVTGHTGIIDRARAKIVGASDYLSKPFTQTGLLKVVFKHLE